MKRSENLALLIGIGCNLLLIFWSIIKSVTHWFSITGDKPTKYFFISYISPIIILLLLMVFPVLLLTGNLKNKNSKILSIITILISAIVFGGTIFTLLTPAIPLYIILGKLQLVDTYFVIVLSFLTDGGLFMLIGNLALAIGGILSLKKRRNEA